MMDLTSNEVAAAFEKATEVQKTAVKDILNNGGTFLLLYTSLEGKAEVISSRMRLSDGLHSAFSTFAFFRNAFGKAFVTTTLASLIIAYSSMGDVEKQCHELSKEAGNIHG
jgi:hypothetical protein